MVLSNKYKISILPILVILSLSTIMPGLAVADPKAGTAQNWEYVNSNSWGWNYSPETQITEDNVDQIEVKWIFPVGSSSTAPAALRSLAIQEGANTPPIVRDGMVYITTNFLKSYGIDAETGEEIWTHDYSFDVEDIQNRLPWVFGGLLTSHLHGIRYWEGGDAIIYEGMACDLVVINAKTGDENYRINDLCKDVPGNIYNYRTSPTAQANIGTWDNGRQFIVVLPGLMHSTIYTGDARHVTMGIDMDTKEIKWRVFSFPPQGVQTKDWALQECDIGFFRDVPCSDVAAEYPDQLEWDWAFPNEAPSPYGGVTSNWGTLIVDEDTGILYTNTGNQGPYTNVSMTPGPRLYGSTLMAIDMEQGQRLWWLQPFPHDPYDYDCNWGGILYEDADLGKVYMKGCKEGVLFIVDAMTGEPHHMIDLVEEQVSWGQIVPEAALEWKDGGVRHHKTDIAAGDLRNWKWVTDGQWCEAPCDVYPHWFNGIFATDMSLDPNDGTLFHYAQAVYVTITAEHPYIEGASVTSTSDNYPWNATIVARDISTGDVKWTWYYDFSAQRSHLVVTPELVFSGFTDGRMRFFHKEDGDLLKELNLGAPIATGPTTGQTSSGDQYIFTIAGIVSIPQAFGQGYGPSGAIIPGTLVAMGLSEDAPTGQTTTITSTATTSTTVTTQTTSTVTEETGLPAEITYAAVAVAVIAIVAAAFLMMRKR